MKKCLVGICLFLATISASAAGILEPLMGHFSTKGALNIQVRSGGCTWKKQFQVEKSRMADYTVVRFIRTREDVCRAYLPYGEIITFSFEELGLIPGEKFKIANEDSLTYVSRF